MGDTFTNGREEAQMRDPVSRRARVSVLVVVAVMLAAGGMAYASIPGPDGVIHGCYNTNKGDLRVLDPSSSKKDLSSCGKDETPLDWNQTGPAGAKGPTGPSDGWDGQASGTVPTYPGSIVLSGGATGIPPGSYLISGQVDADRLGSGSAEIRCFPYFAGSSAGIAADLYVSSTSGASSPLSGDMILGGTTTLTVQCQELAGGTQPIAVVARVHAIRVGALHEN